MDDQFSCATCAKTFKLPDAVRARYPRWNPRQCLDCRGDRSGNGPAADTPVSGPDTGVFTDGCCEPNPGVGGWGVVKVVAGKILEERHGHDPETTNNRMELRALIEGYRMIQSAENLPIFSDSELCVKTINEWAAVWERNGWKRGKKREPVMNVDLVQELYALAKSRPLVQLQWIRGHAGATWNEHADGLSRRYQDDPALVAGRTNNQLPTTNNQLS